MCGGTGTGKTTTARRLLAARTLAHGAAALLIDQKGDPEDEEQLRRIAAAADRPFILFDPRDRAHGPLAAAVGRAGRCRRPRGRADQEERALLRRRAAPAPQPDPPGAPRRQTAGPPASRCSSTPPARTATRRSATSPQGLGDQHRRLQRRCDEHAEWVSSREGKRDLAGGLVRLELVMGAAWRDVLTPRLTADGDAVAVGLVDALRAGAIVMWRTYADDMPDEAAAITVLALADLHAAAGRAGSPWTLMLDEFGAVIHMAAARGVAILQRGRSHHGQVMVISQSAADIEALSQQQGLLPSLSDNFTGFVAHRQTAPETRDWLAKLMGTRAIWQSTDQTRGHGATHSGSGSRRRVREFRVGSDEFATLRRGEAIIYTTLGPQPQRAAILPAQLPAAEPTRITAGAKHSAEIAVHPEETLPVAIHHKQAPSVDEIDPLDA